MVIGLFKEDTINGELAIMLLPVGLTEVGYVYIEKKKGGGTTLFLCSV